MCGLCNAKRGLRAARWSCAGGACVHVRGVQASRRECRRVAAELPSARRARLTRQQAGRGVLGFLSGRRQGGGGVDCCWQRLRRGQVAADAGIGCQGEGRGDVVRSAGIPCQGEGRGGVVQSAVSTACQGQGCGRVAQEGVSVCCCGVCCGCVAQDGVGVCCCGGCCCRVAQGAASAGWGQGGRCVAGRQPQGSLRHTTDSQDGGVKAGARATARLPHLPRRLRLPRLLPFGLRFAPAVRSLPLTVGRAIMASASGSAASTAPATAADALVALALAVVACKAATGSGECLEGRQELQVMGVPGWLPPGSPGAVGDGSAWMVARTRAQP